MKAYDAVIIGGAVRRQILSYSRRRTRIQKVLQTIPGSVRIRKNTTSNLFRYCGRISKPGKKLSLAEFDHVLQLDTTGQTLDVEGAATYGKIVGHTLRLGFLPTVAPELKEITVGGAIAGLGIESSCFKYGFVHDGVLEADVLLPNGEIVTCTSDNAFSDLFDALPNSYGTLGYVVRAKIRLIPAQPYVRLTNSRYEEVESYLKALQAAAADRASDFVEGLFYSAKELYVIRGQLVAEAPRVADIYGQIPYYKQLRGAEEIYLKTEDYIFRYDPDWFWNVPEGGMYSLYRRLAPPSLRHSGFYKRFTQYRRTLRSKLGIKEKNREEEELIQDWQVPWSRALDLMRYALTHVDLRGKPWAATPICTPRSPTLYPIEPNRLYYNLGCYCLTPKPAGKQPFYYTKLLDRQCFELGGIKMLYSSTFLDEDEFNRLYNGQAYGRLKEKYDREKRAPTLYEKAIGEA